MEKGLLKKNKVLEINLLYILSILPLIIYGFYKNGIVVHNHGAISLFLSLQYLVIPIIIIVLSYIFEIYYYLGIKKEDNYNNVVNSLVPYINTLCYLVCGPLDYLWLTIPLIIILDVVLKFIDNKIPINQVALFKCLLYAILMIMGIYNNANNYEATAGFSEGLGNLFMGGFIGEIGTTSTLMALIGFVILLFNKYYKKELPIMSVLSYAITSVFIALIMNLSFTDILAITFKSGLLFSMVYVGSISLATPITKLGRIIYGVALGILSAITVIFLDFSIGVYIIILGLSLLTNVFNKLK